MSFARVALPILCLALAACGQTGAGNTAPAGQQAAAGASACESPAVPLAVGAEVSAELTATTQPYPANARYYCITVPEGAQSLTLQLSGLSADLDLYVGYGDIASVQGVDISAGENYEWKSNAFGAVDEQVVIAQPRAGVYYAEIVSYEGQRSTYRLAAR